MARANLLLSEEVTSAFVAAQEDGSVRGIKVQKWSAKSSAYDMNI